MYCDRLGYHKGVLYGHPLCLDDIIKHIKEK